jgi:prepilin-type N-terminal cleavage/methylation domain-containing protein
MVLESLYYEPTRPRRGFTLMEVLAALGIIAVLTAVVLPALNGKLRDSRTTALSQTFLGLSQGIAEFKRATTMYPSSLTLLTTAPVAGSTLNICGTGNTFTATAVSLWRGPYSSRVILSTGIPMGDAIIPTGLRRVTAGSSTFLLIDAADFEIASVNDLESQLDGGTADLTAGTIRATSSSIAATPTSAAINAPDAGTYNVSYAIPINSC